MQDSLLVRSVQRDEFDAWAKLWDGYNAFYGRHGPTALAAQITRSTWQRFFDAYEPVHGLIAEREGILVGLAHYIFHRSTIQIGPTCYLQDLYTSAAVRGQGIGRALIEAVYDRARSADCGRVYWQTHETNLEAIRLYEKVAERSGFIVYRKGL
ncbi:MAG TPA: GNAT family N-acetyltransferase [Steroidobacteraceae bacterium]|nr:GNAT family N-acetyltransferase [Steroidobacteraceae bacterium]